MSDTPEGSVPAALASPADQPGQPPHPLRTSIYLPAELVPAVDRARALGKSYADLVRDGLTLLEGSAPHEHTWACAICHTPAQLPAPEGGALLDGAEPGAALLAARTDLDRARRENDRLNAELAEASSQRDVAVGQQKIAAEQTAELQAELASARESIDAGSAELDFQREAAQNDTAMAVAAAAGAESELRIWRTWAAQVCQELGVAKADEALAAISGLRSQDAISGPEHPSTPAGSPQAASEPLGAADSPSGECGGSASHGPHTFNGGTHCAGAGDQRDELYPHSAMEGIAVYPEALGTESVQAHYEARQAEPGDWPSSFPDDGGEE